MRLLTKKQLQKAISSLGDEWKLVYKNTKLTKIIPTKDFLDGIKLLSKITVHAEVMNHHPEIHISYDQVKVILSSHDAMGVTALDIALAQKIDQL